MNSNPSGRSGFITILAVAALLRLSSAGLLADGVGVNSGSNGVPWQVMDGLKVSANGHYLVDAVNGKPVFLLADTAWNLGALKLEEIDTYLQSRGVTGGSASRMHKLLPSNQGRRDTIGSL